MLFLHFSFSRVTSRSLKRDDVRAARHEGSQRAADAAGASLESAERVDDFATIRDAPREHSAGSQPGKKFAHRRCRRRPKRKPRAMRLYVFISQAAISRCADDAFFSHHRRLTPLLLSFTQTMRARYNGTITDGLMLARYFTPASSAFSSFLAMPFPLQLNKIILGRADFAAPIQEVR